LCAPSRWPVTKGADAKININNLRVMPKKERSQTSRRPLCRPVLERAGGESESPHQGERRCQELLLTTSNERRPMAPESHRAL
jgi:hypothetical protein